MPQEYAPVCQPVGRVGLGCGRGHLLAAGKKTVEQRQCRCVRVISLDEIALKKGHDDFVLVIGAPEESYVIDLLSDRKKETLEAWFDQLLPDQRSAIQVVCIDMWEAYCSAVQTKLPGVEIVVDRFHVMKNLNHALTTARREIQRQAAPEVKEQLKGSRWVLVRNQSDLTTEQREKLDAIYALANVFSRTAQACARIICEEHTES